MGSPISPIISNLFMECCKKYLLPTIIDTKQIHWYRYVDDIFAVIPDYINLNTFLNQLNNLHPSITLNQKINLMTNYHFQTLTINDITNNRFEFKVYRKPTHSNTCTYTCLYKCCIYMLFPTMTIGLKSESSRVCFYEHIA